MNDMNALQDVFAEMRSARAKHGVCYMGNLERIAPADGTDSTLYAAACALDSIARSSCDDGPLSRCSVLAEEVCEVLYDAIGGKDPRKELVQVAAMALAWLGVDPDVAGDAA